MLTSTYSTYTQSLDNFCSWNKKVHQKALVDAVSKIYIGAGMCNKCLANLILFQAVLEDYLHPSLKYEATHDNLQFDVFVPALCLAFEYQGQQHSKDFFIANSSRIQDHDQQKLRMSSSVGITVIIVCLQHTIIAMHHKTILELNIYFTGPLLVGWIYCYFTKYNTLSTSKIVQIVTPAAGIILHNELDLLIPIVSISV